MHYASRTLLSMWPPHTFTYVCWPLWPRVIPYQLNHHTGIIANQKWYSTLITPQYQYHHNQDQLPEFHTGFYKTINSEFLVQGNFKHTQFSQGHWYRLNLGSGSLRTITIELAWLVISFLEERKGGYGGKFGLNTPDVGWQWNKDFVLTRTLYLCIRYSPLD